MAGPDRFPDPHELRAAMLAGRSPTRGQSAARLAELVVEAEADRDAALAALAAVCRQSGVDPQVLVTAARRRAGDTPAS
jgi:hypothetical protein